MEERQAGGGHGGVGGLAAGPGASTSWEVWELSKTRAEEFPWFLQWMSSAVGGLAAAGTPLVSHRRLSHRRSLRIVLVLLLLDFSIPSEGLFAATQCLLHPRSCPLQVVLGTTFLRSSSSLLWCFREGGKQAGQVLLRHWDLFIEIDEGGISH